MPIIQVDDFSGGVIRDVPKHLVPDNCVTDVNNIIFPSGAGGTKMRRRNAARNIQVVNHGFKEGKLLYYRSEGYDVAQNLIGVYNNVTSADVNLITENGSTARKQVSADIVERIGRPFTYFDVACFPLKGFNGCKNPLLTYAGSEWFHDYLSQAGATVFATPATADITANNSQIPMAAGDVDKIAVGQLVHVADATKGYFGRVTYVDKNSPFFHVSPTPTIAITNPTTVVAYEYNSFFPVNGYDITGAGAGCTHQGRIILADVFTNQGLTYPNMLAWSLLPDENVTYNTNTYFGLTALHGLAYSQYNRIPLPDVNRVIALESISDDLLLVLCDNATLVITGTLPTLTAAGGSITFDIQRLSGSVGCSNDATVQKISGGAMWANKTGVYLFDGSNINNVMEGRVKNHYVDLVNSGTVIQGASLVDNKYYILSTSDKAFVCNLENFTWTFFDNMEFDHSCWDQKENKVYASRVADTTYLSSNDSAFRLDTLFKDSDGYTADYNWRQLRSYVRTKAFSLESIVNKHFKHIGATTQLKCDENYNFIGLNNKCNAVLSLPNAGLETGNICHWYAFGATKPVLTADNPNARTGSYALKCVVAANNCGFQYYLPAMYLSTLDTITVEIWIKASTGTPSVTIELGVNGDIATASANASTSYQAYRLSWSPSSSAVKTGIYVKITSATTVTLYADDLASMVFSSHSWCNESNNNNINNSTAYVNSSVSEENYCIQCITPGSATAEGIAYTCDGLYLPKNTTVTARFRLKQGTASNTLEIGISFGNSAQIIVADAVPETDKWVDFEITSLVASTTYTRMSFVVRNKAQANRTFYVQSVKVFINHFGGGVNFVGGINSEGVFGDGSQNDNCSGSDLFADTYILDQGTAPVKSGGELTLTVNDVKRWRIRSKEATFKSGEAICKIDLNTWASAAEGPTVGPFFRLTSDGSGYTAVFTTDDIEIYKVAANVFGSVLQSDSNTITLSNAKTIWMRVILEGLHIRAWLYLFDPRTIHRNRLDKYSTLYWEGFATYQFDASTELDANPGGWRINPLASSGLDTTFDDFVFLPYDNVQSKSSHESAPTYDRYSFFTIAQAGALEFRSWNGADFDIYGILMDVDQLDNLREFNA